MLRKSQQHNTKSADLQTSPKRQMQSPTVDSSFNLWRKWLYADIIFQAVFGLAMIFLQDFLDEYLWDWLLFYGSKFPQTFSPEVRRYVQQIYVVLGGVMVGWSVMLWFHVRNSFPSGGLQAWYSFVISFAVWFVLDTAGSLAIGYWQNAVLNVSFALLYAIPLAASFKFFKKVDGPAYL